MAAPGRGADHHRRRGAVGKILRADQPALSRRQTERTKIGARHRLAAHAFGAVRKQTDDAAAAGAEESVESADAALDFKQLRNRQLALRLAGAFIRRPDAHETIGLRKRHAAQQHGAQKRRHRRRRRDAERRADDRGDREPRRVPQAANRREQGPARHAWIAFSTRATAVAIRSQFAVSTSSCLRPARVSR